MGSASPTSLSLGGVIEHAIGEFEVLAGGGDTRGTNRNGQLILGGINYSDVVQERQATTIVYMTDGGTHP